MTRSEHLRWCKDRAMEYCDAGDISQAWASMASDMGKHDETKNHSAIDIGTMMMLGGMFSSVDKIREFILGFN